MTTRNPYRYNKKLRAEIIKRSIAKSKRIAQEKEATLKPLREFVAEAIEQHQKAGNE